MIKVPLLFLVIAGTIFLAGYLGHYEILLAFTLLVWVLWTIHNGIVDQIKQEEEENPVMGLLMWFSNFKKRKIQEILEGKAPKAYFSVILMTCVFGWILSLLWLFFRDWHHVLAREIRGTVLDLMMGFSCVALLPGLRFEYDIKQKDDTPNHYHPLDPDAHDPWIAYAESQTAAAVPWANALYIAKNVVLLVIGFASYGIGFYVERHNSINWLDRLREWVV